MSRLAASAGGCSGRDGDCWGSAAAEEENWASRSRAPAQQIKKG